MTFPVKTTAQTWGHIDYDGEPWVKNVSLPVKISAGLAGRHLALWQSHGRYYDRQKGRWQWQRPLLFGTTEDLFTQTIVVPFLIPMLENAGANVITPRERDWQTDEYIVDPDGGLNTDASCYREYAVGRGWQSTGIAGFRAHSGAYQDGENPFTAGSARMAETRKKGDVSFVTYQPHFARPGRYAVYVSYQTVDNSVDDAHYTIFHQGVATELRVNQQMGGGTWVYLGTFDFDAGQSIDNSVMLTCQSRRKRGIVTTDAVRFGGGMGNISRGGTTSGLPRALEGARYSAQWAGVPYKYYSTKNSQDDYGDDINARSLMVNWLAGGSIYVPTKAGLGVPIELSLAIHSDAGKDPGNIVGSLAICTTDFNDGVLASGVTRQLSKRFAEQLLDNVTSDLQATYGRWNKRYLWDRNYSETRLPEVPSAILETMSHQNFDDMRMGQDPAFRFTIARSIYKTIARYVARMHHESCTITPLAPQAPSVELLNNGKARLTWLPQNDPLEPSAKANYYIVQTAIGHGGFDNGVKVKGTAFTLKIEPDMPYSFRVLAANKGGVSFLSEVVAVARESQAKHTILVVNGFHRLSAPAVDHSGCQTFDPLQDEGVGYGMTAGWAALPHFFQGNTFDYAREHVQAIAKAGGYNVVSCSSQAVEDGRVAFAPYYAVDVICGLERYNPDAVTARTPAIQASLMGRSTRVLSPALKRAIAAEAARGGRILVSGAYVASDMLDPQDRQWLATTLHAEFLRKMSTDSIATLNTSGLEAPVGSLAAAGSRAAACSLVAAGSLAAATAAPSVPFYNTLNTAHYAARHVDALLPAGTVVPDSVQVNDSTWRPVVPADYATLAHDGASVVMTFSNGLPAAIGYNGALSATYSPVPCRTVLMGLPLECVIGEDNRSALMRSILRFLLE